MRPADLVSKNYAFAINADRLSGFGGRGEDTVVVPVPVAVPGGSPTVSKRGLTLDGYPGEISTEGLRWGRGLEESEGIFILRVIM